MRWIWRGALLLAIFVGIGVVTAKLVVAHSASAGRAEAEVRLAGEMAGLFAGGATAVVVGIAMALWEGRRR